MILFLLLIFFSLLSLVLLLFYFRSTENSRLDYNALQNLLSDQEKAYYIDEYKKILAAKIIYERMVSDDKSELEVAREVIKSRREK